MQFFSSNTKITALKSAVNSFIDIIARDNPTSKIAIVKFAGNKTDSVGNDTYKDGSYTYNYTQIVQNLTEANTDGASSLKAAVNALTASGATAADYGLEKAINVFGAENNVPKDRNRVVIMFTDGEPNHGNGFSKDVANTAIENAQTLKSESYGASVYTIGIFSGAQVGTSLPNGSTNSNRYMHLVSSNYPNASSMSEIGEDGAVTNGFYKVASDANSLGNVFTQLGEAIGKPSISLGSNAVLTDNIVPNFIAPANVADVKVYTADYDGTKFGARTELTGANVSINNNAVTVTGFNYSENFVSDTAHPGMPNNFGKKLIVEFEITVDRTKTYGGTQPANAGANITLEGKEIASVENPQVPVSIVNGFGASYKNSKTYDGKGFTIENEFKEMLKTNVLADGEKNDYVNITYTVTDKDNSISSYYDEANKRDYDEYRGATFYYTRNSYKVAYMNKSKNPVRVDWYKYEADISDAAKFVPDRPYGVPADYIFEGWYSDEACNAKFDFANKTMPYDNITVYANWVPPVCNVEFVAYGETVKTLNDVTYGKDIADKIPTVTLRDGDVLYGWTYDELGTQLFKNDTLITKSYTLYAQIGNKDGYTVTYDANGGTGTAPTDPYHYAINKAAMVLSGSGLIAPLGTVFIGWNTAADGSGTMYYPGSAVPVTDNITLYAMWGDKTGSLEISKTISGNAADKDKEFTFTVALTNEGKALSGAFGGVEFKDGKASFKLKADESKTFTGLPDGIGYTVTESDNSGYSVSIKIDGADAKAAQGTIAFGHTTKVVFNNHRNYVAPPVSGDEIIVEITGNSDSVVYDGTEHNVKGYTVEISDSRYTEKDFTFSGKDIASGVNAGSYEMGLKAEQFKNTNARFANVEFIIKADGVLTITQRPLTITAGSAEGIAPVTCDKYTVEGLATGDKVDSVKLTGAQTTLGESPNVASDAVIKNAKGEDVTANYEITYVDGLLKGIELLEKEIHFNYVIGYTDGTIRPGNNISRAEVATIFFRLLTDEAREQYNKTTTSYSDIKDGAWCCRAVATLTNAGVINGYTDGTFRPNAPITRAELATIIARFAKLDVNTKTFSDITGHWAQKNIELAVGNGWINGYDDGTFRPNNNITRAETFAMINRVLDRQTESVSNLLPTSDMNMWSDNMNENAWYYKDVQEATNYHKCDRVGDSVYEKWTEKVPDIDWASYQI